MNTLPAVALVAALLASPAATPPAAPRRPDVCVASQPWMLQGNDLDRSVLLMESARIRWMKLHVQWKEVEPRRGYYSWLKYDRIFTGAAAHGVSVIATVPQYDGPPWATGSARWSATPRTVRDFGTFMRALAARFRGRIAYYEVGNEPNSSKYWYPRPSVAGYAALLREGYLGVKAGDPRAQVISAGAAPWGPIFIDPITWARQLYAAGAGRYADALGAHPASYPRSPDDASATFARLNLLADLRGVMVRYGYGSRPIINTEFGWSTARDPSGVSRERQGQYLVRAFTKMRAAYPYVPLACIYTFRDLGRDPRDGETNFGVVSFDFVPKPAYYALRDALKTTTTTAPAARTP